VRRQIEQWQAAVQAGRPRTSNSTAPQWHDPLKASLLIGVSRKAGG
jgi:hypothetical protein